MSGTPQSDRDSFVWIGTTEGDWRTPSNWADVTTGTTPSAIAPDAASNVTIANGAAIDGDGTAAALYITGDVGTPPVTLSGRFSVGLLSLSGADGAVEIAAGGTAVVGSLDTSLDSLAGLTVEGSGATFELTGTATVDSNSVMVAAGGGAVQLAAAAAATLAVVDTLSLLEVGPVVGVGAGTLEIDAGQTVAAVVAAPVLAVDGLLIVGTSEIAGSGETWAGHGTVEVAAGTTLVITNLASSSALSFDVGTQGVLLLPASVPGGTVIKFAGTSGVLGLSADVGGSVSGLQLGDDLVVQADGFIAGASYVGSAPGTGELELLDPNGTVVGTIDLLGSFAGDTFLVTPLTGDGHTAQINIIGQGTGVFRQDGGTYTWVGPAGGAWDSPIDWSSGTVPTSALGSAIIDGATSTAGFNLYLPITGSGGAETATISNNVALDGALSIGSVNAVTADLLIGSDVTAVAFTQAGGVVQVTSGHTLETSGFAFAPVPDQSIYAQSFNSTIDVSGIGAVLDASAGIFAESDVVNPQGQVTLLNLDGQATISASDGGTITASTVGMSIGTLDLIADAHSAIVFGTAAVAQAGSVIVGADGQLTGESLYYGFYGFGAVQSGDVVVDAPELVNLGSIELGSLAIANSFIQAGKLSIAAWLSIGGSMTVDTTLSAGVISVAGAVVDDGWIGTFAPELISFGASLDGNGTLATAGSIELFTPTDTPLGDGQYPETFYELGEISVAGAVMGSLTFLIGTLGSLALAADAAPTDRIMLTGETAGLLLSVGPTFAMDAPISGFEATDTITIADASTIASALFTQTGAAGGTLALMDAARDVLGDLTLEGTYAPHQFAVASSSGAGGIVTNTITLTAPCFAAGTRVATPGGAVAVERLRVGEAVLTAAGAVRRIRWIGHRDVACRRHPEPALVLPVRIEAGAFAPGCPKRPLLLSPDHAVFVEAVLVPIKYLINGRSIRQVTVEEVGYWHVELDAHDILLAEGLPCESYLDTRNRSAFANGGIATQLHPDFAPGEEAHLFWEAAGCAPLRIDGAEVARVRAMLARRARRFGHDVVISKPVPCAAPRVVTDLAALLQPDRYRATYADVAMAGVDPRAHYAAHGRAEGRLPCSAADLLRGLGMVDPAMLPFGLGDLVDAGLDVAAHYVRAGWREQRRINPYFDAAWYCARNDVPDGVIPLLHYLLTGEAQGRAPGPHFDPAWYRATYAIAPTHSALAHYLAHRRTWRVSPNPRFDLASYIRALGDALLPGRDPYAHYRAFGQRPEVDDRWLAA